MKQNPHTGSKRSQARLSANRTRGGHNVPDPPKDETLKHRRLLNFVIDKSSFADDAQLLARSQIKGPGVLLGPISLMK